MRCRPINPVVLRATPDRRDRQAQQRGRRGTPDWDSERLVDAPPSRVIITEDIALAIENGGRGAIDRALQYRPFKNVTRLKVTRRDPRDVESRVGRFCVHKMSANGPSGRRSRAGRRR